jgi:hypothetical protein
MHAYRRQVIHQVLIAALLFAVAMSPYACTRHPERARSDTPQRDSQSVGRSSKASEGTEKGRLRIVVTDPGDAPRYIVRYHVADTEAHARVQRSGSHRAFEITLVAPQRTGLPGLFGLSVRWPPVLPDPSAPTAPWGREIPPCEDLKLDSLGRVQNLDPSSPCEQPSGPRRLAALELPQFTVAWPSEPIGVGAEWTVSATVGDDRQPRGDATVTLLARRGNEHLVAYSTENPGRLLGLCPSCSPADVVHVWGVSRVDVTRWLPVAQLVFEQKPTNPKSSATHSPRARVSPDWATGSEGGLLDWVLPGLESQRANVRRATVRVLAAFPDAQVIEPLWNARKHADPSLRSSIDETLEQVTRSEERGLGDLLRAALDVYCKGQSLSHAIALLNEGLAVSGGRSGLRAETLAQRGVLRRDAGDLAGAAADFARALEIDPVGAAPRLSAAWWYATAPTRGQRDGARALALIEQLGDGDPYSDRTFRYRDNKTVTQTWAAALAEVGRFKEALARQEHAKIPTKSFGPHGWTPTARTAVLEVMAAREDAYQQAHAWRGNWIAIEQLACASYREPFPGW